MKVLKFGGTSVGSVDSIRQIQQIIARQTDDCIVVVSALGGITDQLLRAAHLALENGEEYMEVYQQIRQRHLDMIQTLIENATVRQMLCHEIERILDELRSILFGVHLIKDLSPKSEAAIVSYGERMSSRIVTAALPGAVRKNSLEFIRTEHKHGQILLNSELTDQLVREAFSPMPHLAVCPGFISRDSQTEEVTNLGRGGSDYTASILAATLGAEVLEIWTDVNGFMTADPRLIPEAYTIQSLSYVEATELCNFGAKVVYPPTIYPVCAKNIPIRILNTFSPDNAGTVIHSSSPLASSPNRPISYVCGLSSIRDVAMITVSGLSMVGVIGVNQRIFGALANAGVSVFLVSQASSENSTTLGVQDKDCDVAVEVLTREFAEEIKVGSMYPMLVQQGLAAVSIVGEKMKNMPGIAGKLFGTLGRNGISVIAFAQGAKETNISFVVPQQQLSKTMNVLHDSFFLSENKVLNIFICGVGTVGAQLIEQIQQQQSTLLREQHLQLNVVGIANSRGYIFNAEGLDLTTYREQLASNLITSSPNSLIASLPNSVFVDCTASADVADSYLSLLENNISVVTANKIAASSAYSHYQQLKQTALNRGVKFLFETNVGAGLPIISTINDLRNSGDKILRIEAVLSGTLNFIFNEIAADVPFSETIRRAKEQGYSEPDPRIDLSGKDVIRKLVILAREAGYPVEQEDVEKHLFVPEDYFQGSVDDFWKRLPELDADFEARRQELEKNGLRWRFVATMEEGKTRVALETVDATHPFYPLEGSNNIILLTTERYHDYPMMIRGYGAGASVTAAGVFANIMQVSH